MSSAEIRGRFVWHELLTPDTAAAGQFYPRVAGWKSQPWEKNANYTLWVGSKGPMGGLMSMPTGEGAPPSQWMPYIGTPDIAGTLAKARDLGAQATTDITDIPDAGQFAVLADPQGAAFAIYAAAGTEGSQDAPPDVGDFSWHELATSDTDAALSFYSELFGWAAGARHDMGEMGYYQLFQRGGRDIGGIYKMQPGVTTPHWLSYVRVKDVNRAVKAANTAGGRVINGPMEVPGGDWIAHIEDPQGVRFAVHQFKPAAKKEAKPPAREEVEAEPAETAMPAQRAAARRPGAAKKKRSTGAKKSASATRKRVSRKPVVKSNRAKSAKHASAKRASTARKRPGARRRAVAKKKSARGRVRAKRRR